MKLFPAGVLILVLGVCGCGGSTTSGAPSVAVTPTAPSVPSGTIMQGSVNDAVTDSPIGAVTVQTPESTTTSNGDGTFRLEVPPGVTVVSAVVTSPATIRRDVRLRVEPGPLRLSLIPSSFDLTAFDELARSTGTLYRWTTAPALVVERAVLRFTNLSDGQYIATDQRLSESDAQALVNELGAALPQLTGNVWSDFSSRSIHLAETGTAVSAFVPNTIVVGRFDGLLAGANYAGYGRWRRFGNVISQGTIFLDLGYDTRANAYRSHLRAHELGHTLGYGHVTVRPSVMNDNGTAALVSAFDLVASKIAYQRAPGNVAPDADPSNVTLNSLVSVTRGMP